ncbi:hypothetical protein GPECTOR_15g495 [Gonium pectorale]|uniref:Uncharacterized protein n=1 Tax=Gonium pectorale TaxID=33097 RepID=A0A150GLS5_GONPE|nr:hypothetical protein GPECTOR_15g495 [Gonium pectorale]|eukprot:KXZ50809.1 hypothetical protein GPECTOR_15g495 [Gonium pectorale]
MVDDAAGSDADEAGGGSSEGDVDSDVEAAARPDRGRDPRGTATPAAWVPGSSDQPPRLQPRQLPGPPPAVEVPYCMRVELDRTAKLNANGEEEFCVCHACYRALRRE